MTIQDAALVIAVFWKRFGTPIPGGKTGTEHEIQTAYDAWRKERTPDLMVYFNRAPVDLETREERRQYYAVCDFREDLPSRFPEILHGEYRGLPEFSGSLRRALENWLRSRWPLGKTCGPHAVSRSLYLASAAPDEREALIREIEVQGWAILPERPVLAADEEEMRERIGQDLRSAAMSIHLAGKRHSFVAELEAEMAEECGRGAAVQTAGVAPYQAVRAGMAVWFILTAGSDTIPWNGRAMATASHF